MAGWLHPVPEATVSASQLPGYQRAGSGNKDLVCCQKTSLILQDRHLWKHWPAHLPSKQGQACVPHTRGQSRGSAPSVKASPAHGLREAEKPQAPSSDPPLRLQGPVLSCDQSINRRRPLSEVRKLGGVGMLTPSDGERRHKNQTSEHLCDFPRT